jgi:hypothetical protein
VQQDQRVSPDADAAEPHRQTEQEITMSRKKTVIALSAALALGILGSASTAQASDHENAKWYPQDDIPGPPIHAFSANAYGFVPSKKLTHRVPRSPSREQTYSPRDK